MAQLSKDAFAFGGDLIRVEEALALVTARIPPIVGTERVQIADADGRVLVDREGLWPRLRGREPSLRRADRVRQAERTGAALAGLDRVLAP